MNTNQINLNNVMTVNNIYNKNITNFKEGDILTGYIKSLKDNIYTIDLENKFSINVEKEKIVGNVGDTIYFRVEDDKNTLKQIIEEDEQIEEYSFTEEVDCKELPKKRSKRGIDEDTIQNINNGQKKYKMYLDKNSQPSVQENMMYSAKLKSKLSHLSNTISKEDLQQFINSGINPKNLDMLTFSDFLAISTGVDVEGKEKEEKTLQELKEDKKKYMKMDLNMNGVDEEDVLRFESILEKFKLPKTERNISNLKNIKQKIENIQNVDKKTALNIIKNEDNIKFEDVYTSKYNRFSNNENVDISNIDDLDTQIENVLKQNDVDITKENVDIAKDFIKNEVDISFENVDKFKKLQNLKEEINVQDILEKAAKNMLRNKNILDIDIFNTKNIEQDYKNYKKILPNILPEHIQTLIDDGKNVNLKNITNAYNNNIQNVNVTEDAIKERINLYKIQLKLTSEAMYSLYDKGIDIDTKPLKDVIKNLEDIERENYKKYLIMAKAPATTQNIETMENVFSTIQNIETIENVFSTIQNIYPNVVSNAYKDIIEQKIDFSINGIRTSLKAKNILNDFETFKTRANTSFGDNINKLTDSFKDLLTKNGFEPNENNLKALKILSLNSIDFTEENLLKVKNIDSKIDYLANNLHPLTVAKMLKDNFNPMDKDVNEVIDYIDNNSISQTSREKIAEQILEIDKENKLSKEERDAIVSVYRMLNIVQKGDSVAIGNLLKSEKNLTLKNLLEASKIYEKNKKHIQFDEKIDANTGESEKIVPDNNITKSIKTGIEKANEDYNNFILGQILNYANPNKINNINDFDINIESLLEKLKEDNNKAISTSTKDDILENVKSLDSIDPQVINYLIKNNLPITLINIQTAVNLINKKGNLSIDIQDFKEELEKRDIAFGHSILSTEEEEKEKVTKEDVLNKVNELEEENNEAFDDILNLEDLDDIKYMILKNKKVSNNISFMKDNNQVKNGIYTFPIRLQNGKITDFNMYILNDKALDDKNLNLYLDFENMSTYVKVANGGSFVEIATKESENVKNYEQDILNILAKFKIYPKNITYSHEDKKDIYKEEDILSIEQKFKEIGNSFNKVI